MSQILDESLDQNQFRLIWNNLSFITNQNKVIINKLNGEVASGRLTAILGPSGSGKTTFIECIANKRKAGLTGDVFVHNNNKEKINIRIAYNSQKDALIDLLTVEESLLYASQLKSFDSTKYDFFNSQQNHSCQNSYSDDKNYGLSSFPDENIERKLIEKKYCNQIHIWNIIEVFGLRQCANVRAIDCSGGQRKRLSIALELIFSPNILLLDEPTSGLDSVSCLQCVSLLKILSKNKKPIIIAASVHQPSARILSYFDNIYVLSINGDCIYNGPTDALIDHLSRYDLTCPIYHNPADFVLEIASGDHGKQVIDKLIECQQNKAVPGLKVSKRKMLSDTEYSGDYSIKSQTTNMWILLKRCTLISLRDPIIYWLRLLGVLMSMGTKFFIYRNSNIGQPDGCLNATSLTKTIGTMTSESGNFNIHMSSMTNIGYLLTLILFTHICTIAPTLMTFPIELSSFAKERFNNWYTDWSYFIAKSLADIPSIIIFPVVYATLLWVITNQIDEMWRFNAHLLIILLNSLLAHSLGLLISAYFINNINAGLITFAIVFMPFMLFSGFLIPINKMPKILQPLSYLSVFRLAFESLILIIYGFGRCKRNFEIITTQQVKTQLGIDLVRINECFAESDSLPNITEQFHKFNTHLSDSNPSKVLEFFLLDESTLYLNITLMALYAILLRVLAYYALKWKTQIK